MPTDPQVPVLFIVVLTLLALASALRLSRPGLARSGRETQIDDPVPAEYEAAHARDWLGSAARPCATPDAPSSGRCCRMCGRADGHWSGCLLAPKAVGAPLLRSLGAEE